jgi:hypothetical protein
MLPVSGAEQLNTSGDQLVRPMISQSGAYSRLESPSGARLECGRKRFHRPAFRALGLSSSMTGTGSQRLSLLVCA